MQNTNGMRLTLTRTACKVAAKNGWTAEQIQSCFDAPKKVYPSKAREGQFRIVNKDICIVGVPVSETEFRGITMFANGSTAPIKEDV